MIQYKITWRKSRYFEKRMSSALISFNPVAFKDAFTQA